MKISVVIPARNEEKYIEKTLLAILAQDHSDYEVIVVDNGSTDRTIDIVRKFIDKVKLLEENSKGLQRVREKGRLAATGELIASLDADCLPSIDWLQKAERHFEDSEVVAVTGPYLFYDGGTFFKNFALIFQKTIYKFVSNFLNYFKIGAYLIHGNTLMRAKSLNQIGGYDTSIIFYGDDTNTAKRLSKLGKVIHSNDLVMKTSARRFKKEGILKTTFLYLFYFLKETL